MNALPPPHRDVAESLEVIARFVSANPAETPAQFVIELAQHWKGRGGLLAGKPRHSDRYLDDLLRRRGTPIRSLTPKLGGKTHLRPDDAEELVRLFLSHWTYIGDPHSGDIGLRSADRYEPLLPNADIEAVCAYIAERIAAAGAEVRGAAETGTALPVPGQDMSGLIAAEFKDAAAYFQIGAGQTVLVTQSENVLLGFRDLMDRLWDIDSADGPARILIWTLDLGRQDFEDLESRLRFMNVEALVSRFKALRRFREEHSEERWDWLQSRTVIVLHDTKSGRPEVARLPAFDPHHVLFSAIPPVWAGSPQFHTLYGTERLRETNYSIFLKKRIGVSPGEKEQPQYELRYFGHALLKDDKGEPQARALELDSPGRSYVEALGTVFEAAARTLGLRNIPTELSVDGMKIASDHAIEKLRHHGFLLLRLEEFMRF
jgi:hypothetical protein